MDGHIGQITLLQFHIVEKRLNAKLSDSSHCGNQERKMLQNNLRGACVPLIVPGAIGTPSMEFSVPEMNSGARILV